jgi:hypothetical protein
MSEEESSGSNMVKGTLEAATGLVKAVPIYEDAIQPVAKQLGKSLELVGRAVNAALMPVKGLVWGIEEIEKRFKPKLIHNLEHVQPEDIIPPKLNVAGPAIEALRYTGHEESLSDMYANLLASAMDKKTADGAHPAFVEIIRQLTPDEARLIAYFIQDVPLPLITLRCQNRYTHDGYDVATNISLFAEATRVEFPALVPSYLDNLSRLGLIEILKSYSYTDPDIYTALESSLVVQRDRVMVELDSGVCCVIKRGSVRITHFGEQFGVVCVASKSTLQT